MTIIITNDDSYKARGLQILVEALAPYGELTIVAPKHPQSGMSMAVSMGYKPIAVKHLTQSNNSSSQDWWYLDGTPASCVKFATDNVLIERKADLVVSGINHGSNAATAAIYSGTLGAAMEGAVNGILSIGVSLDSFDHNADFSTVRELLPGIIDTILSQAPYPFGTFFNINFPYLPSSQIKGIRLCSMGKVHWENEYQPYLEYMDSHSRPIDKWSQRYLEELEEGEKVYVMAGDMTDNRGNGDEADHIALKQGYITITPHNIDNSRPELVKQLADSFRLFSK